MPEAVEIDGIEYAINHDFRTCLKVILAFEDVELSGYEKRLVLLGNMYPIVPDDTEKAVEMAVKFLDGGKGNEENSGGGIPERLFSFQKDANFIFSAFKQTHGIDLEKENDLHWWKFIAMFMDLGGDTFFCNLTALRKRIKSGKGSEDDYRMARELGDIYELDEDDTRTPEEIEMDEIFDRAMEGR